jgi:hypothetical protein
MDDERKIFLVLWVLLIVVEILFPPHEVVGLGLFVGFLPIWQNKVTGFYYGASYYGTVPAAIYMELLVVELVTTIILGVLIYLFYFQKR